MKHLEVFELTTRFQGFLVISDGKGSFAILSPDLENLRVGIPSLYRAFEIIRSEPSPETAPELSN